MPKSCWRHMWTLPNTGAPCPELPNLRTRDSPILVPNYDFEEFRTENQAKTRIQNLVFWNTSFGFLYGIPRYFRGNAMKFALISLSSVIMYWVSVTLPLVSLSHYTLSTYYIIYTLPDYKFKTLVCWVLLNFTACYLKFVIIECIVCVNCVVRSFAKRGLYSCLSKVMDWGSKISDLVPKKQSLIHKFNLSNI